MCVVRGRIRIHRLVSQPVVLTKFSQKLYENLKLNWHLRVCVCVAGRGGGCTWPGGERLPGAQWQEITHFAVLMLISVSDFSLCQRL